MNMCVCIYIYVYIYRYVHMCMSVCVYLYVYILFVIRVDFNWHHEMRSTSNIWCQRFKMITLKCDIVLFESQI